MSANVDPQLPSDVAIMIDRHRRSMDGWQGSMPAADDSDPRFGGRAAVKLARELERAEANIFATLVRLRPRNDADAIAKAGYLASIAWRWHANEGLAAEVVRGMVPKT